MTPTALYEIAQIQLTLQFREANKAETAEPLKLMSETIWRPERLGTFSSLLWLADSSPLLKSDTWCLLPQFPLSAHSIRSKMAAKTLCVFYFCLLLFISTVIGQLPKKEKYYAIKEDLPYIRCETCQKAVKYLYGKTQEMRRGAAAKKVSLA